MLHKSNTTNSVAKEKPLATTFSGNNMGIIFNLSSYLLEFPTAIKYYVRLFPKVIEVMKNVITRFSPSPGKLQNSW